MRRWTAVLLAVAVGVPGVVASDATVVVEAAPLAAPALAATDAALVPLVPGRLLETRSGAANVTVDGRAQGGGRVRAGGVVEVKVVGRGGVPADAAAVMLNVAAVTPDGPGHLTVYPCGSRPHASSLNYGPGAIVANAVLAKVSTRGTVCVYTHAGADIIADVTGYVPAGGQPFTLKPARLLETRIGGGNITVDGRQQGVGRVRAGGMVEVEVAGRGGVPTDVDAVFVNVTAIAPDGPGHLTVYGCGTRPHASSLNYGPGTVIANAVLAKVSASGTICVYTHAGADIIVDVTGYVAAGGQPAPVAPARLLETRVGVGDVTVDGRQQGIGRLRAGAMVEVTVSKRGAVPEDATAVMVNVAAILPEANGYLTVYPCGSRPHASSLNYAPGSVIANAVLAKVSTRGTICIYTRSAVDVIVDVTGYVRPAGSTPIAVVDHPSAARLVAGKTTATGGVQLNDEVWLTFGTPEEPIGWADASALALSVGASLVGGFEEFGVYQFRWPTPVDVAAKIRQLEASGVGVDAGPSVWGDVAEDAIPSDLADDGADGTWQFDRVDAYRAWDRSTGSNVKVGIVDLGTALRGHEDLNVSYPVGAPVQPAATHATRVAGYACAKQNNKGLVGTAWGCPIISVAPISTSWYDVFAAATTALDAGAQVINMSLGFAKKSDNRTRCLTAQEAAAARTEHMQLAGLFRQLFGSRRGQTAVWTLSAGNNCVGGSQSPTGLAAVTYQLRNVLIVSATNSDDRLASFSNFPGNDLYFQGWVAAPGGVAVAPIGDGITGVWSTSFVTNGGTRVGTYAPDFGTSFAAPIVAGIAALVRAKHPAKTAEQAVDCIVQGSFRRGVSVHEKSQYPAGWVSKFAPVPGDGIPLVSAKEAVDCYPSTELCEPAAGFVANRLPRCADLQNVLDSVTLTGPSPAYDPAYDPGTGQPIPVLKYWAFGATPVSTVPMAPTDPAYQPYLDVWVIYKNTQGETYAILAFDPIQRDTNGAFVLPPSASALPQVIRGDLSPIRGTWHAVEVMAAGSSCHPSGTLCVYTRFISRPVKQSEHFQFTIP